MNPPRHDINYERSIGLQIVLGFKDNKFSIFEAAFETFMGFLFSDFLGRRFFMSGLFSTARRQTKNLKTSNVSLSLPRDSRVVQGDLGLSRQFTLRRSLINRLSPVGISVAVHIECRFFAHEIFPPKSRLLLVIT